MYSRERNTLASPPCHISAPAANGHRATVGCFETGTEDLHVRYLGTVSEEFLCPRDRETLGQG